MRFMQHILEEVMDLFPGPFIHVGGDEALKTRVERKSQGAR
ncbi:MAG: family 20 glycosylhydrolase [Deinococcales bacterium]